MQCFVDKDILTNYTRGLRAILLVECRYTSQASSFVTSAYCFEPRHLKVAGNFTASRTFNMYFIAGCHGNNTGTPRLKACQEGLPHVMYCIVSCESRDLLY